MGSILSQTITWVYAKIIAIPYSFSPYKTQIPILWAVQPPSWLISTKKCSGHRRQDFVKQIYTEWAKEEGGWVGVSEILDNPL